MFKIILKILINFVIKILSTKNDQHIDVDTDTDTKPKQPVHSQPNTDTEQLLGMSQEEIESVINIPESKLEPVNQPNIIKRYLSPDQYVQDSNFVVNQIVLHHTAGGSAESTIKYWESNKERVCTHFIIDRDGTIYKTIPLEKSWGYHLYVSSPGNKIDREYKKLGAQYDKQSIGIELCNYGYLNFVDGKFVNYVGKLMDINSVVNIPQYKGHGYWETYSQKQILALEKLLLYLVQQYPIIGQGLKQDYSDIFEINKDALDMKPGIYSHTSYRTDKFDLYPNPDMIQMLNQLHIRT